jgi:spermidine/putrescine transport system permease protein
MTPSYFRQIYVLFIILFLYFPLLILVIHSFNHSNYLTEWSGFSLRWFSALLDDQELLSALSHSIILGLSSALLSTLISVISCIMIVLNNNRQAITHFLLMPSFLIILPDLILGIGFMLIFNIAEIPLGFFSLLIAHITFSIPFIIFTIFSQIEQFNKNLYFAALDLGASRYYIWKKIILPLLRPSLISGFLLGFTLSFDDVVISYFVSGPEFNILPLTILSMIRGGSSPELNALCSITLIFSFMLILITHQRVRRSP